MKCCVNCFEDQQLIARIKSLSSLNNNCDYCGSLNVTVIECCELFEEFNDIFSVYEIDVESSLLIHEHINQYWKGLFKNSVNISTIKEILLSIVQDNYQYKSLFEQNINFKRKLVETTTNLNSKWDLFSNELKDKNRFFIESAFDLEIIEFYFSLFLKTYTVDTKFYRARISEHKLPNSKLGKPPKELATPGRANPVGIPYLYVSNSILTTLYETRASLHEGLTIGTFVNKMPLNVI